MVFDSSSLISLARAGLLQVLERMPFDIVLLDVVWDEVVVAGRAGQHADAVALAAVLDQYNRRQAPSAPSVDDAVLRAAADDGALACNDMTLGRRARNLGARWLRTADLLVLLHRSGRSSRLEAVAGVQALIDSGRITAELGNEYLEVLS